MSATLAKIDEARMDSHNTAEIIAAFYNGLMNADMDEQTARAVTQLYTQKILNGPRVQNIQQEAT